MTINVRQIVLIISALLLLISSANAYEIIDDFNDCSLDNWTFSGDADWNYTATSYEGVCGARAGVIGDSQTSSMNRSINVTENSTLSYYWFSSCEWGDDLYFYINGVENNSIAGVRDDIWKRYSYYLEPGTYDIKFTYDTDGSGTGGDDTGYIDFITLTNVTPTESQGNDTWSEWGHDNNNTGRSEYYTESQGAVIWTTIFGDTGEMATSPSIWNNLLYVSSSDDKLYILYKNGSIKCNYTAATTIYAPPAIDENGDAFFGDYGTTFYSVDSDCNENWNITVDGYVSMPAKIHDGVVYFTSGAKLYAVYTNNGTVKWTAAGVVYGFGPALDVTNNQIYASGGTGATYHDKIVAFDLDTGAFSWSYQTGSGIYGSVSIDGNQDIYFNSYDGKLYSLDKDGNFRWSVSDIAWSAEFTPTITNDSAFIYYHGEDSSTWYATIFKLYSNNGTVVWSRDWRYVQCYSLNNVGAGALDVNGTFIVSTQCGEISAFDPDGNLEWAVNGYDDGYSLFPPTIGNDGVVYIGGGWGNEYYVMALYSGGEAAEPPITGYNFSGFIYNPYPESGSEPLGGAVVNLSNATYSDYAISDNLGYWYLNNFTDGYYNITISKPGFDPHYAYNISFESGGTHYNVDMDPRYIDVIGWNFTGYPWVYSECYEDPFHSYCSARSNPLVPGYNGIDYNSTMWTNITVNAPYRYLISYNWRQISSKSGLGTDTLRFKVNGSDCVRGQGTEPLYNNQPNWAQGYCVLGPGTHKVEFIYQRTETGPYNYTTDGGFVDYILLSAYENPITFDDFDSGNLNTWTIDEQTPGEWIASTDFPFEGTHSAKYHGLMPIPPGGGGSIYADYTVNNLLIDYPAYVDWEWTIHTTGQGTLRFKAYIDSVEYDELYCLIPGYTWCYDTKVYHPGFMVAPNGTHELKYSASYSSATSRIANYYVDYVNFWLPITGVVYDDFEGCECCDINITARNAYTLEPITSFTLKIYEDDLLYYAEYVTDGDANLTIAPKYYLGIVRAPGYYASIKYIPSAGMCGTNEVFDLIPISNRTTPHVVKFIVQSMNGTRYSNVNTLVFDETNKSLLWGITGSDGSVVFTLVPDRRYRLDFTNSEHEINLTRWLYPVDTLYMIYIEDSFTFTTINVSSNLTNYTEVTTNRSWSLQNLTSMNLTSSIGLGPLGQGIVAGSVNWMVVGFGGPAAAIAVIIFMGVMGIVSWAMVILCCAVSISIYILQTYTDSGDFI